MWNFCLKLWFFLELLIARDLQNMCIEFSTPQTQHMCHSSHFNAFFPVKINKMWNYLSETVIFQEPLYHRDLKSVVLNLALPQTLNTAPLKQFQCIVPSQNEQNVKFWLCPELPLTKNWKTINLHREKVFTKTCKSAHIGFLGMPIAMHYVTTLCDKYFLSY